MSDFKPPKPNKAFIGLAKFVLPFYLKFVERLSFSFSECAGDPIQRLKQKNVVIVINHSDRQDPLLLVALAKHMHEEFYCIVARESFDACNGILGWMFQRFGCFSVDRGSTDFRSIHTMKKILTEGDRKLIVFPEGEVTGNDHIVHEISPALMHVFLNAQKDIANDESLWVLPIGVSYKLETKLRASVDKTLTQIEQHLDVESNRRIDAATRAGNNVAALLRKYSKQYKFDLPEQQPQHEQVRLLARHICEQISASAGITHDEELPTEQLLYYLRSHVSRTFNSKETLPKESNAKENASTEASRQECAPKTESKESEATKARPMEIGSTKTGSQENETKEAESNKTGSLDTESKNTGSQEPDSGDTNRDQHDCAPALLDEWLSDFDRVQRLLILQSVLDQPTSAIQVCRVTDFLELEICGRMTAKGQQRASVYFGDPIDVLPYMQDYESDKNSAVEQLRDAVHKGLQSALQHSHGVEQKHPTGGNNPEPIIVSPEVCIAGGAMPNGKSPRKM